VRATGDVASRPLDGAIAAFLKRATPIRATLVAVAFGPLAAGVVGAGGTASLVGTLYGWWLAVVYGLLPCYEVWRGAPSLARIWTGSASNRTFWLVVAGGVFALDAYEALNVDLQFKIGLGAVPIDKHPAGVALAIAGEPLTEELFFQVGLQTWLERFGGLAAIAIVSLLFTLVHVTSVANLGSNLITHLPGFLLLAVVWQRFRSLGMCVLIHAGYNATLLLSGAPSP